MSDELTTDERLATPVRLRLGVVVPLVVFLGLAIHYFLPRVATVQGSLETARTLRWMPLTLAVAAQALSYVANGSLLAIAVTFSGERLPLRRAVAIVMAASTVCLVAGGVVGYAASVYQWTLRSGTRRETAAIASAVPTAFDTAALLAFALVSAAALLRHGEMTPAALRGVAIAAALLLLAVAIVTYALIAPDRVRRILQPLLARSRFRDRAASVERTIRVVRGNLRGGGARAAAAAVLNLLFDVTTLALVFRAAGHPIGALVLLGGYGVPLLLGRSSLLPGGVAVVEIGMIAAYTSLGVPADVAVVAVLAYRLFSFWLPTLVGIPIAVALQTTPRGRNGNAA
jgi:glycosyltransferase 2 family protein